MHAKVPTAMHYSYLMRKKKSDLASRHVRLARAYEKLKAEICRLRQELEWGCDQTGVFVGYSNRDEQGGFTIVSRAPAWVRPVRTGTCPECEGVCYIPVEYKHEYGSTVIRQACARCKGKGLV